MPVAEKFNRHRYVADALFDTGLVKRIDYPGPDEVYRASMPGWDLEAAFDVELFCSCHAFIMVCSSGVRCGKEIVSFADADFVKSLAHFFRDHHAIYQIGDEGPDSFLCKVLSEEYRGVYPEERERFVYRVRRADSVRSVPTFRRYIRGSRKSGLNEWTSAVLDDADVVWVTSRCDP